MVEQEYCQDWYTWANAFNISSAAGGYIVSYLFFVVLAVTPLPSVLKIPILISILAYTCVYLRLLAYPCVPGCVFCTRGFEYLLHVG